MGDGKSFLGPGMYRSAKATHSLFSTYSHPIYQAPAGKFY